MKKRDEVKDPRSRGTSKFRTLAFFLIYVLSYFAFFREFSSYTDWVYANASFPGYMQMILVYAPLAIWLIVGVLLVVWIIVDILLYYRINMTNMKEKRPRPRTKVKEEEVLVVE